MAWFKCNDCRRVLEGDGPTCEDCLAAVAKPKTRKPRAPRVMTDERRTAAAEAVRRHREKTGNAYGKKYEVAKREAVKALIALHPEDWARLMAAERRAQGLG